MTHGFDDEGSQFDGDGNLRDWWSKATKAQFATATKCVVDQYAKYEAVPGVHLNGKLTAGENIADNGGVKLAYEAYKAWRAHATAAAAARRRGLHRRPAVLPRRTVSRGARRRRRSRSRRMRAHQPALAAEVAGQRRDRESARGSARAFKCAAGDADEPGHELRRLVAECVAGPAG